MVARAVVQAAQFLGLGSVFARIGRAHLDPCRDVRDLLCIELSSAARRRHLHVLVRVSDGLVDERFRGVAWDDAGAAVAALERGCGEVEREAALALAGFEAVALVALFAENRQDLALEKVELLLGRLVCERRQRECKCSGEDECGV